MQLHHTLSAPLLILQLLQNFTAFDNSISKENQKKVLHILDTLEHDLLSTQSIIDYQDTNCDFVLSSVLRSDVDGCNLQHAIKAKNVRAVELMIQKGITLTGTCGNRNPPLFEAIEANDMDIIELLLSNHVNLLVDVNSKGLTPLQEAVTKGLVQVVTHLIGRLPRAVGLHITDKDQNTLAHLAAQTGHISVLKSLIGKDKGLLESRNKLGETPLLVAAAHGHKNTIDALLNLTANWNAKDKLHNTVLHKAAEKGHKDLIRYILKQPNMVTQVDNINILRNTPLHVALLNGHEDTAKVLWTAGADIMLKGQYGNTVLHLAALGNLATFVERFLEYQYFEVEQLNDQQSTPLHKAATKNSVDAAKMLLQKYKANPNAVNKLGQTPLHLAALINATEVVQLLLKKKANKDAVSKFGETPSSLAAKHKYYKLAWLIADYK